MNIASGSESSDSLGLESSQTSKETINFGKSGGSIRNLEKRLSKKYE
jgi:hypothetical protein